jgi:hypothetical protein
MIPARLMGCFAGSFLATQIESVLRFEIQPFCYDAPALFFVPNSASACFRELRSNFFQDLCMAPD